jgi:signal transduction histidine kinase
MRLCYRPDMPLARRDLFALAVVVGAAVASLVVWDYGRVDIGMALRAQEDRVMVRDVTPDGNAARSYFSPGATLLELTTVDGGQVRRGEPIDAIVGGTVSGDVMPWEYLGPTGGEIETFDRDYRLPVEAVDSARIAGAVAGDIDVEGGWISTYATIDRGYLEFLLQQSIWLLALGIGVGAAVWRLLDHGLAGPIGRQRAILLGAVAAVPFLLLPVIQVGTPVGIIAGYLVPATLALLLGMSLARAHPDRAWGQTAIAAAIVAAGLATIFVVRYMTSPALTPNDRGGILLMIGAIAVVPALILAASQAGARQRGGTVSLALVPLAALTLIGPSTFEPIAPILLLTALLGWQLLPVERGLAGIGTAFRHVRPSRMSAPEAAPGLAAWRDRLTVALFAVVVLGAVYQGPSLSLLIIGVGVAALVGFVVRAGFLGADWTEAATPLAAAVGIPIVVLGFAAWEYGGAMGWAGLAVGLAGLGVAHVLAWRHSDVVWRDRLFLGSVGVVVLVALLGGMNERMAIVLAAFVPLIPGIPAAFAEELPGEARALTSRLETLAVALTPGAAATVVFPETSGILLGAWLVAVIVWRQFTLRPLVGMAQRTQLQRDVAVAAAETERARLAADLHDDALQQLTMLVRTLDESGQADAAGQAREVATKLRSIVGDLRLPILDDLGAGAALEWLVERVEPLAGGPVRLERSDASRPPANVELAVFRVAQEALTNAIKHGMAPIAVRYDVNADGRVTLAIDDAGAGIGDNAAEEAPREGHFGLLNMHQRAEQIGALLDVRKWPAGGTRVALEWRPQ